MKSSIDEIDLVVVHIAVWIAPFRISRTRYIPFLCERKYPVD